MGFNFTLVKFFILIVVIANTFSSICFGCAVNAGPSCSNFCSRGVVQKCFKLNLKEQLKVTVFIVAQCFKAFICSFRKYPYPPHGRSLQILRGGGVGRSQRKKYENYTWNNTILI